MSEAPARCWLVAPYARDGTSALSERWVDQYTGTEHPVTVSQVSPTAARLMSIRHMLARYATHPEPKSAGTHSGAYDRAAVGLLARRPVHALTVTQVGKEGRGAQVDLPSVEETALTQYTRTDATLDNMRAALHGYTAAEVARSTGLSTRTVKSIRNGHTRPNPATLDILTLNFGAVAR